MKWQSWMAPLALAAVLGAGSASAAAQTAPPAPTVPEIENQVRKELAGLPYYGVFDLLTFQVSDKGVVTLGGYVVNGSLKGDAEHEVKKVEGVTEVANRIEIAPASMSDDDVRWAVYRAVYRDSFLSRYGTPDDALGVARPRFSGWGRGFRGWGAFGQPRWMNGPFFGLEPVGDYAIHILVKNGSVTLAGVVDNPQDRDVAGLKANGVSGVFSVTNDLQVAGRETAGAGR
jgi:hyperosmotically inducible periplasmic protein